jgi:hypothetical protein
MFEDCYLRLGKGRFVSCTPLTVGLLASLYALPERAEVPLRTALEAARDGQPWSESLAVAPEQTASAVTAMLRQVMLATPDLDPARIEMSALSDGSRAKAHLGALVELWRAHPEVAPAELRKLGDLLSCGAADALQAMSVLRRADDPRHSPLQCAVLAHLEAHHGAIAHDDPDHQRLIGNRLVPAAPENTLLGHVQRRLLDPLGARCPDDGSLALLSIRDSLTETEAAAAIIQRWLANDVILSPADIAVIIPHGGDYALALAETFANAGLLTSSLPTVPERRNIGAEAVLHFLQCRRRPAPAMALASLYCSPVCAGCQKWAMTSLAA